jgi:hypothetical protein
VAFVRFFYAKNQQKAQSGLLGFKNFESPRKKSGQALYLALSYQRLEIP